MFLYICNYFDDIWILVCSDCDSLLLFLLLYNVYRYIDSIQFNHPTHTSKMRDAFTIGYDHIIQIKLITFCHVTNTI